MTTVLRQVSVPVRKARLTLVEILILAAICTSPFQKAFTLPVGFPLKLSELFFVVAFVLAVLGRTAIRSRVLREQEQLLLAILVITGMSTLWAVTFPVPQGEFPGYTRSITFDALLYLGYTVLVVLAWRSIIRVNLKRLVDAISFAVHAAAAACILQYVLWTLGQEAVLKSWNFEMVFGSAYGSAIPRNGSFMEGNYLGFFAGVSLLIMIRFKKAAGVISGVFCILYSQSTNAILALIVAIILGLIVKPRVKWHLQVGSVALAIGAILAFVPAARNYLGYQLAKVGLGGSYGTKNLVENIDDSLDIRGAKIQTALDMFTHSPLLGVGPGRFGVWFEEVVNPRRFPPEYFSKTGRHIVENAYAQILAELGLFAFLIFMLFLFGILRKIYRINTIDLVLGLFILLSLNTAPAWTSLSIWIAIGYLGAVIISSRPIITRRAIGAREGVNQHPFPVDSLPLPLGKDSH